ncbi:MAG: TetR/AcrR family transcriptional regulator [Deltaproteobacteria bacterium]|nr:TetR/AcrR family transcriptional regulator [Deltaproteobacteria bacterium]
MKKMAENPNVRERILFCAEQLFTEKGYSNTSIRDVCNAANANIALVNYYFKSKEEMYKELIKTKTEPILRQLRKIIEDKNITSKEKFSSLFKIYEDFYEVNRNLPQIIAREIVTNTDISKWFHKNIIAKELKMIKRIFEDAQRDGVITDRYDPVTLMNFSMGAIMFILAGSDMVQKVLGSEFTVRGNIKEKIENLRDLLMNGIKK